MTSHRSNNARPQTRIYRNARLQTSIRASMLAYRRTFPAATRSSSTAYKAVIIRTLIRAPLASSRGRNPGARGRRASY